MKRPYNCPRWDLAKKTKSFWAKSRGSTLVSRAYMRKVLTVEIYSQYARKKCLNTGREESVGNDDVSIVCNRMLRSSLALRVISHILWSSCFESDGPKDTS